MLFPKSNWFGLLLVIIGSVMLAAKGLFAKHLYGMGIDFETVVAVRTVIAVPGFFLIALAERSYIPSPQINLFDYAQAALAGLTCYYFGSFVNFYALTLIDASLERVLLYSYPAMVVLLSALIGAIRIDIPILFASVVTYCGIAIAVGAGDAGLWMKNSEGALWVLTCSLTIAIYFLFSARLTNKMGSGRFTFVAMCAAGMAYAVHYEFRFGWNSLSLDSEAWSILIIMIVFVTVLPLYLVAEGVRRIGASRAAIASAIGPPATAVMAVLVQDEILTMSQVVGMIMVIAAILWLELRQENSKIVRQLQ